MKKKISAPFSYEDAAALLSCDFETGAVFWKATGKPAFTSITRHRNGTYLYGRLLGKTCLTHRLIWLLSNKAWPVGEIDHIDGDCTNNSISNLRDVTVSENQRNARRRKDNTSGVTGVHWETNAHRWVANIRDGAKQIRLGKFINLDDAIAARNEAAQRLGYHENHGRAA